MSTGSSYTLHVLDSLLLDRSNICALVGCIYFPIYNNLLTKSIICASFSYIHFLTYFDWIDYLCFKISCIYSFTLQSVCYNQFLILYRYSLHVYLLLVSTSYSKRDILMWFSLSTHCLLKDIFIIFHSI